MYGQPKRILIIHASVGSGHKRAAQAIEEAVKLVINSGGEIASDNDDNNNDEEEMVKLLWC